MTENQNKDDTSVVPFEIALDKAGFGLYSYLLMCLTGFGIISFVCVVYATTIIIPASACELQTTNGQQGAMAAAPIVGSVIGNLVWGYLADTRGRRNMLLVALLVGALINALASLSVNWIMLLILQFITSTFSAGVFPMSMSLLSESVPMTKRNLVVLVVTSIFLLSQGIIAVLAIPIIPLSFSYYLPALGIYWNSWRTLLVVYSLPSVVTAIWLYFMQESPKYVFANGEEEEALKIMKNIHRINNLRSDKELEVKGFVRLTSDFREGKSSIKDQVVPLFRKPLLKYTLIMMTLMVFQQLGAFLVWLPTIANQFIQIIQTGEGSDETLCGVIGAGLEVPDDPDSTPCALNVTALLLVLIVGALQSLTNAVLSLIVNAVGRRNLVMVITAVCGISGILVNLVPNAIGSAVLFVILLQGVVVLGLYTAIVIALFPTHLRALALALPLACTRLVNFASIQIFNLLLVTNCDAGFYIFATLFASSAIVASFLPDDRRLPATKHKDKEEANDETLSKDVG